MTIPEVVSLDDVSSLMKSLLRGMWRHRWHMLGISWFVCITGWTYVLFMPNLYQVEAKVSIVDPQKDLALYLKTVSPGLDVTSAAKAVLDQLLTRDNIAQALRETEVSEKVTDQTELEFQVQSIRQALSILPQKNNIYLLSIKHSDPKLARQVVKGLVDILIMKGNQGSARVHSSQKASSILEQQINDFQTKMAAAEDELRSFRKKNIDVLGEDDTDFYQRLKSEQNQLEREQLKVKELEKKREEINRQLLERGVVEKPLELDAPVDQRVEDLRTRLRNMQSKYYMKGNVKRPLYPDDNPEVLAIHRAIENLEEQKRRGIAPPVAHDARKLNETPLERSDPFVAKLKMNLSDVDVELVSLIARTRAMEKKILASKELEPRLPAVMSEMEHYKKKVSILKDKLSHLMSTQGEASFSGNLADNLSKLVTFEVSAPPEAPRKPIGPNRPLFVSIAFAAGIFAGLITALLLAYSRPVFDSPMHLKQVLGLPVLGTVSMVEESAFIMWLVPRSIFYWLILALFAVYGLLMLNLL